MQESFALVLVSLRSCSWIIGRDSAVKCFGAGYWRYYTDLCGVLFVYEFVKWTRVASCIL